MGTTASGAVRGRIRDRARRLLVVLALGLGVLVGGLLTSTAAIAVQCGPGPRPCRLVVSNRGYWPVRVDPGSIRVDGAPARLRALGIAGPFGSAAWTLYGQDSRPLLAAGTVRFVTGPLLGTTAGYALRGEHVGE